MVLNINLRMAMQFIIWSSKYITVKWYYSAMSDELNLCKAKCQFHFWCFFSLNARTYIPYYLIETIYLLHICDELKKEMLGKYPEQKHWNLVIKEKRTTISSDYHSLLNLKCLITELNYIISSNIKLHYELKVKYLYLKINIRK